MKKILAFVVVIILVSVSLAIAAGSCTESSGYRGKTNNAFRVILTCTGDASAGTIPDQALSGPVVNEIMGMYLYSVSAWPTSGGTAPDAADVFVLDAFGEDLLGSADGGTTANKGANLIHATLKKTTLPYSYYLSTHYFPVVTNTLTVRAKNQGTASANFTIELDFVR